MLTPSGKLVIPQKYLPFLGAGAAAVATLAYILWGPDFHRRGANTGTSKRRKVAGLENLGNTCYLNTVLQSLAACPAFVKWLSRALRQGFFKGKHNELAYKLSKTLEVVNDHSTSYGGSQVYSPHEVLHALYTCSWRADRGQQDAHELFQFLLSVLGEEKEPIPTPVPLCDASRLIEPGRNGLTARHSDLHSNIEANLPKVAYRDGESPFRGLLANHLSCTVCRHRNPVTYSSFDCLTLPIPTTVFGTLSLESILAKFTQCELVHDVECTECSKELSSKIVPLSRRTEIMIALPASGNLVPPPTPKHAPTASKISAVAPPSFPVNLPSSGIAPPTSQIEPPTSQRPLSSPSTLTIPTVGPVLTDSHPASAVAPPTLGRATPNSDQRLADLHIRTPPPETLPSDDSQTDGLDQQIQEQIGDNVDVPSEATEESGSDVVTCYHGNNGILDALPCSVSQIDTLQDHMSNTATEKSSNIFSGTIEATGSDGTQNLSGDSARNGTMTALDVNTTRLQVDEQNFEITLDARSIVNESTQASSMQTEPIKQTNPLKDGSKDLEVNPVTGAKVNHQMSQMMAGDYFSNETLGNGHNEKVHSSSSYSDDSSKRKSTDENNTPVKQAQCSKVAPPKWQSAPKPHPSPVKKASSSADKPCMSIFGRIPGTDGVMLSLPESADQSSDNGTNEDLSPKCRRMFRKQLTLGKLPQCLCIHLQRVTWLANSLPSRREEYVIFPEYLDMSPYKQTAPVNSATQSGAKLTRLTSDISEDGATPWDKPQRRKNSQVFIGGSFLLDNIGMSLVGGGLNQMSPRVSHNSPGMDEKDGSGTRGMIQNGEDGSLYMSSKPTEARYRLASAVVHQGDAYSGHFLTFRRAPSIGNEPLSDNWLCVSDESVYTSTTKEVFSQKAYMLYYQRM